MNRALLVRILAVSLTLVLQQNPLAAQPSAPNPPAESPPEPQPPPPPPDSQELVQAPTEPEEDVEPTTLPGIGELTQPTDAFAGAELEPVSATQTLVTTPGTEGTSHLAVVSSGPMNYQDESGKWKPIDPKLRQELGGWQNTAGPFEVFLPEQLTASTPVRFSLPQGSLSFVPDGADPLVKGKAKDADVTYKKALPDTDLVYSSTPEGLKEEIVLTKDDASPSVSFVVTGVGLSLAEDDSGGLQVLAGSEEVAAIAAPTATDTSEAEGPAGYGLTSLGPATWRLTVSVDEAWYMDPTREFPVVVDPPITTFFASQDTFIRAGTTEQHGNEPEIAVGYVSGTNDRHGLVGFDLTSLVTPEREIYDAHMWAWSEDSTWSTPTEVDLSLNLDPWNESTSWANHPDFSAVRAVASGCGAEESDPHPEDPCYQNSWFDWEITDVVQEWVEGTTPSHGVHLHGDGGNVHFFASSEHLPVNGADVRPYLVVQYNDPPAAAQPIDPPDPGTPEGQIVESDSPSLTITKNLTDPNGDKVYTKFQVAEGQGTGFSNIVAQSGWMERQHHWVVPSGILKDGLTYHWRVKTSDLLVKDQNSQPKEKNSVVRHFTLSLKKWGSDPRWAMWGQNLGNGMRLEVNQANGNLYLDYPLDSLSTQAGPLDLHLGYNSQATHDFDFSQGWVISAGSGNDAGPMPVRLSVPGWGGAQIRFSDGDRMFFPKIEGDHYGTVSAGAGTLTRSATNPRWRYRTATGSRYTFNDSGALTSARVSTGDWAAPGFEYGYTSVGTDERLSYIRDPLGRQVDFHWIDDPAGDLLVGIETWDSRQWGLFYDAGKLIGVTDSAGANVNFDYNPDGDLMTVTDGEDFTTLVTYSSPLSGRPPKVAEVTPAGVTSAFTFLYSGPYTGQMAFRTDLTDPRGVPTPDSEDYTTRTFFNVAGLPIRVDGPRDLQGLWGITTQLWDTNSNLVCRRSPSGNAAQLGCDNPAAPGPHDLQTDWTYQSRIPYLVTSETRPMNQDGERAVTTYGYDEGFQELYAEYFSNTNLAGEPVGGGFETDLDINWGAGAPAPLGAQNNNWSLRLTGRLEMTTGRTFFKILSATNDGVRLQVGSKEVFDCWSNASACELEDFEFENGEKRFMLEFKDEDNNAKLHLQWHKASQQNFQEIPTSDLAPETNLLTSVTDPAGTTSYTYTADDKARRRVSFETRGARTTGYVYDEFGRIASVTDPRLEDTLNTYTGACLTKVIDRTGAETRYVCNGAGDVIEQTRVIRAAGTQSYQERVTKTAYDPLGRLDTVQEEKQDQQFITTVDNNYDDAGRLISSIDALGGVTEYGYNPRGLLTTETLPDPDGGGPDPRPVIQHTYDPAGNRASTTDARGRLWTTSHDALNRVVLTRDPLCDLNGDADPTCSKTAIEYDLTLNLIRTTDPAGVETVAHFDFAGQKVSEALGSFPSATFDYDPAGRLVEEVDPAGVTTTREYNIFGEMTSETRPTGPGGTVKTTGFSYDVGGRMTSVEDALDRVNPYGYDDEGRLTSVTLPLSPAATTNYMLDDAGELVQITDAENRVRSAVFDERGRRTSLSDPKGTTTYVYDDASRLKEVQLPTGVVQHFEYDALGRRIRRFGGDSDNPVDDETYQYDPAGNMTQASKAGSTVQMTYDPAGRIQTVTAQGSPTSYEYTHGQLTSTEDVSGESTFTYNANGQLQTLTDPVGSTLIYDYYPDGRKYTRTMNPAGLTSTWTYDLAGRVDTLETKRAATPVASADLDYDALGNVTSKNQQIAGLPSSENGTWGYSYDQASRLIGATPPSGAALAYGYDKTGNRTSVTTGNSTVTTALDDAGHPTSASDGTDYQTDATGALLKITRPGSVGGITGTTSYTYDTWGRLSQAAIVPLHQVPPQLPETVFYSYDALDRMTTRDAGPLNKVIYRYSGQGQDVVKETKSEGLPFESSIRYSHSPEGPLATATSSGTSWFATDTHGDVVAQVSSTSTTGSRGYSPWGEQRATSGTAPGPFGFQGDWTDPSTKLVDMGARMYGPELGRFTTMDPLEGNVQDPTSLNRFVYAGDSPISWSDPTGLVRAGPDSCGGNCSPATNADVRRARQATVGAEDHEPSPPPLTHEQQIIRQALVTQLQVPRTEAAAIVVEYEDELTELLALYLALPEPLRDAFLEEVTVWAYGSGVIPPPVAFRKKYYSPKIVVDSRSGRKHAIDPYGTCSGPAEFPGTPTACGKHDYLADLQRATVLNESRTRDDADKLFRHESQVECELGGFAPAECFAYAQTAYFALRFKYNFLFDRRQGAFQDIETS